VTDLTLKALHLAGELGGPCAMAFEGGLESTTTSSKSPNVWPRTLSRAARRKGPPFRTGITTLIAVTVAPPLSIPSRGPAPAGT